MLLDGIWRAFSPLMMPKLYCVREIFDRAATVQKRLILISFLKEIEIFMITMDFSFYLVQVLTCIVTSRGPLFRNSV